MVIGKDKGIWKQKIWGIGLSRTGTTTLQTVLKSAGYNILHYADYSYMTKSDVDGATDIPVVYYYKKLDRAFPNSKFICTVRDKESWVDSMEKYLVRKESWGWTPNNPQVALRKKVYGSGKFDRKIFSEAYDRHKLDIEEYFKNRSDDLLYLDIIGGDNPQKLARFLSCPAWKFPDKFPVTNMVKT